MALTKQEGRALLGKAYGGALSRRKSKYGNRRVQVDGIMFNSVAESKRYGELKLMERADQINNLTVHHSMPFWLTPIEGIDRIGFVYVSDFRYTDHTGPVPVIVVEDVKGVRTSLYRLKKKLIEAQYGIKITEIDAANYR